MKKIQKYISVLLAFQLFFALSLVPNTLAAEISERNVNANEAVLVDDEKELVPLEADECSHNHLYVPSEGSVSYFDICGTCKAPYGVIIIQCIYCTATITEIKVCNCVPN